MIYLILAVFTVYYGLILLLIAGWTRALAVEGKDDPESRSQVGVTVVVPFRNEASQLDALVSSLSAQHWPGFEVILVDDHSDDGSASLVKQLLSQHPDFRVVVNRGIGKKEALTSGIDAARGEVIVATDADCRHAPGWLEAMATPFIDREVNMVFSAVKISGREAPFQSLEFVSVVATGVALYGLGKPIYCNGASMAFRKSVFTEVGGYSGNDHIASGDDEFLLKKVVGAYPDGLRFVSSPESVVLTTAQPSLRQFVHQRVRWAGKWRYTQGSTSKWLAAFMFCFQPVFLLTLIIALAGFHVRLTMFLLAGKFLLDFVFLFNAGNFLKEKVRLIQFFAIQLLYPFYVLSIGVMANFADYSWKGRNLTVKRKAQEQA